MRVLPTSRTQIERSEPMAKELGSVVADSFDDPKLRPDTCAPNGTLAAGSSVLGAARWGALPVHPAAATSTTNARNRACLTARAPSRLEHPRSAASSRASTPPASHLSRRRPYDTTAK